MEEAIEKLSVERDALMEELNSGALSGDEASAKAMRLSDIGREIEEKELRWLELAEFA